MVQLASTSTLARPAPVIFCWIIEQTLSVGVFCNTCALHDLEYPLVFVIVHVIKPSMEDRDVTKMWPMRLYSCCGIGLFFYFVLSVTLYNNPAMAFDNSLTLRWIERANLTLDCSAPAGQEFDRNVRIPNPDSLRNSWQFLKSCRDAGIAVGPEVTAAEHYLYIRFVANATGDTFFRILPSWYNTLKEFAQFADLQRYLQTSDQPVSPADPNVVRWGEFGVEDGLLDYKDRTGDEPKLKSSALDVGFEFLSDSYYQ